VPEPQTSGAQSTGSEAEPREVPQGKEAGEGRIIIVEALNPPDLEPSSGVTQSEGAADGSSDEGTVDRSTPDESTAGGDTAGGATGPTGDGTTGHTTELMSEPEGELSPSGVSPSAVAGEGRGEGAPVPAEVPATVVLGGTEETQGGREAGGEGKGAGAGEEQVSAVSVPDPVEVDSADRVNEPSSPSAELGAGRDSQGVLGSEPTEPTSIASSPEPESVPEEKFSRYTACTRGG